MRANLSNYIKLNPDSPSIKDKDDIVVDELHNKGFNLQSQLKRTADDNALLDKGFLKVLYFKVLECDVLHPRLNVIFPKDVVEQAINHYVSRTTYNGIANFMVGYYGARGWKFSPTDDTINLNTMSHLVERFFWRDLALYMKVLVFNNNSGRNLIALIEGYPNLIYVDFHANSIGRKEDGKEVITSLTFKRFDIFRDI